MADKLGKFVVVREDFWHESYTDVIDAVTAAFNFEEPKRLLHVVQEIDLLGEWERCPTCGNAVEKGVGCWKMDCVRASWEAT